MLSATNTDGAVVDFFQFTTTSPSGTNPVAIQDNKPGKSTFYLNSGISLFQQYDVIYNLQDGQIGFEAIPEPSTWALLGLSAIVLAATARRKLLNRR